MSSRNEGEALPPVAPKPASDGLLDEPMLRYFAFEHLRPGIMQATSREFSTLAHSLVKELPRSPERTVALRKLLESKDAAVRAALDTLPKD